jgi:hypothetical protein
MRRVIRRLAIRGTLGRALEVMERRGYLSKAMASGRMATSRHSEATTGSKRSGLHCPMRMTMTLIGNHPAPSFGPSPVRPESFRV